MANYTDNTDRQHVNDQRFTGPARQKALVDAASVAVDTNEFNVFYLLFTSAIGTTRAIANPTNLRDGRYYLFIFDQDASGSRVVTWGSKFNFSGGTAPTLTITASKRDVLMFRYDLTRDKLDHLAIQQNL
jgi:hypothetical protein